MKKSLFGKLLLTHVFIITLNIVIISVLFYIFFSNYYFNTRELQLISHGNEIVNIISPYLKSKDYDKSNEIVNILNKTNTSHVWVVDRQAQVLSGSEGLNEQDELCPNINQLQRALNGEIAVNRGDISIDSNHAKSDNIPVLSVAIPVYVDNKIEGAIFVCNPISEISRSITQTFKIVIMVGMISILILIFISNFVAKSITRPLEEMTKGTLAIAKGNFNQKIQINSSDEVGKLADTFNYMAVKIRNSIEELEKEKNKMAEIEKLQREFVANASHELRTPLTSIRGYLEAIIEGVVRVEDEQKYIGIMLKETMRLHKLVNSLLDLSRIESGKMGVNKTEVNISETIEKTISQMQPLIENHRIELELILPENLRFVYGDEDLIAQVIINYITNGIRFTPEGGKITVKAENFGDEVQVHVIDTGIGIPSKEIPNVWKRFYKVNEARTLSREGAGLGLSLVKEIIEQLGGRVWVESTYGKGSRFSFSLNVNM